MTIPPQIASLIVLLVQALWMIATFILSRFNSTQMMDRKVANVNLDEKKLCWTIGSSVCYCWANCPRLLFDVQCWSILFSQLRPCPLICITNRSFSILFHQLDHIHVADKYTNGVIESDLCSWCDWDDVSAMLLFNYTLMFHFVCPWRFWVPLW